MHHDGMKAVLEALQFRLGVHPTDLGLNLGNSRLQSCNSPGMDNKTHLVWARRAHNKTVVASQGASTDSRFMEEKLWLELSDGDENWHERWLGHGRRLEGLGFGITRAQRA